MTLQECPTLAVVIAAVEKDYIGRVLTLAPRIKDAASVLGIEERTLREKRRKLGLPIKRTSLGRLRP